MSLYTYLDTPNSNLVCCICRTPFTDPTTTTTCTHTFCRECILRALSHTPLCPIDRSPLSEADLGPSDPIIRSLVEELEVECVHHNSGCQYTCQRQSLPAHLRDDCMYGQVECGEEDCGLIVVRADLKLHRQEKHGLCEDDEEEGTRKQEEKQSKREDNDSNHKTQTAETSSSGQTDHQQQQKTIELLTEQNVLLRYRVELLEGAMQVMKKEMGAVRNALGPWFRVSSTPGTSSHQRPRVPQRTDEGAPLSPTGGLGDAGRSHDNDHASYNTTPSVISAPLSPSSVTGIPSVSTTASVSTSVHQQGTSRMSQQTHLGQGQGQHRVSLSLPGDHVHGVGVNEDGRFDPLAGYFPTLGEFGMFGMNNGGPARPVLQQFGPHGTYVQLQQQQQQQQQGVGVPGVGGGGPGGLQIHPQAVTRVAPLDLGTNLVGTLEGLRESVVGVAAGLDSLGRRSEIALANETLRLGEEVISLRAGVHGLRMQIHAMMMERNAQITGREEGGVGGSGLAFNLGGPMNPPPPVPPRMYTYGGPPNITKL